MFVEVSSDLTVGICFFSQLSRWIFSRKENIRGVKELPPWITALFSQVLNYFLSKPSLSSYTISTSSETAQNDLITFGPVISPWMITYILVLFPSKSNILLTYHHNHHRLIIVYEHSLGNSGLISQNDNWLCVTVYCQEKPDAERYFECWNQYTVKVTEELTAMGHTLALSPENLQLLLIVGKA